MSRSTELLAAAFPAPSPVLVAMLDELRLAAVQPPESHAELQRLATLPRPWDPASCPGDLRSLIYLWLDDVVEWINTEHTWRVDHMIPVCWMQHPHIVHELAAAACSRWEASYAVTPHPLEDWHKYTLPALLDRLTQRIGATGCPPGRHQEHPGASRHALMRESKHEVDRRSRRVADAEN